ncbi:MAG: hypothetical protein AB7S38_41390 [Vulcanimicrobiota bacterium]
MSYPSEVLGPALTRLGPVLEECPFPIVILMGSAAEGRPFRDLDLAFLSTGSPSLTEVLVWGGRFERAAGVPVDLTPLSASSLGFQYEATKGRVLLCRDPEMLADWKERTWRTYFDQEHHFRAHARDILTR